MQCCWVWYKLPEASDCMYKLSNHHLLPASPVLHIKLNWNILYMNADQNYIKVLGHWLVTTESLYHKIQPLYENSHQPPAREEETTTIIKSEKLMTTYVWFRAAFTKKRKWKLRFLTSEDEEKKKKKRNETKVKFKLVHIFTTMISYTELWQVVHMLANLSFTYNQSRSRQQLHAIHIFFGTCYCLPFSYPCFEKKKL